ncbi:hypothetical protein L7F22_067079 [Adiantum nelumboides]|nr:hypothetical protein [Adiantum nelumboides]
MKTNALSVETKGIHITLAVKEIITMNNLELLWLKLQKRMFIAKVLLFPMLGGSSVLWVKSSDLFSDSVICVLIFGSGSDLVSFCRDSSLVQISGSVTDLISGSGSEQIWLVLGFLVLGSEQIWLVLGFLVLGSEQIWDGGPTHLAILSQSLDTIHGSLWVTIQGEVIQQSFGEEHLCFCTLQRFTAATWDYGMQPPRNAKPEWRALMDEITPIATDEYCGVVFHEPQFVEYFWAVTLELEYGRMNIGSRPSKRKPTRAGPGSSTLFSIITKRAPLSACNHLCILKRCILQMS